MDSEGDITDTFDDAEQLVNSVTTGRKGPWNDDSAVFEDPKLKALKEQMAAPEKVDYQKRRLRELQERAQSEGRTVPRSAGKKPAPNGPIGEDAWGQEAEWGEGTTFHDGTEQPGTDQPPGQAIASTQPAPNHVPAATSSRETGLLVSYAPPMLAATLVFVGVTVIHGLLGDWQVQLLLQAGAATVITGILWRRCQSGRLRAIAIASVAYGLMFAPSSASDEPQAIFALLLGLLVVIAGSGLMGVQRNEFDSDRS